MWAEAGVLHVVELSMGASRRANIRSMYILLNSLPSTIVVGSQHCFSPFANSPGVWFSNMVL